MDESWRKKEIAKIIASEVPMTEQTVIQKETKDVTDRRRIQPSQDTLQESYDCGGKVA